MYLHRIGPPIPDMLGTVGISESPVHMSLDKPVPTVQASSLYRNLVLGRYRHDDWNQTEYTSLLYSIETWSPGNTDY